MIVGLRKFNDSLPDDDRVSVHLVDTDGDLPFIHHHLQVLCEEYCAAPEVSGFPSLSEFRGWGEDEVLQVVDDLESGPGAQDNITNELQTLRDSIRIYFAINQSDVSQSDSWPDTLEVREERIATNVQNVLRELEDEPALALYGGWHTQKLPALTVTLYSQSGAADVFLELASWVQRLSESGVHIYSVLAMGISGESGFMYRMEEPVARDPEQMRFEDGISVADVFNAHPQHTIVYIDLRLAETASLRLANEYRDTPAGEVYDGIVLFREVSPIVWSDYP
jgi:hypothetical protein